jgi:predicted DNA-binding ribbon-helix-helix protein
MSAIATGPAEIAVRGPSMCHVFASIDRDDYEGVPRSLRLGGHVTSIRLESIFWEILDEIAAAQAMSTPRFISRLYDEVLETYGGVVNFTSLLRIACLRYTQNRERTVTACARESAAVERV